MYGGEGSTQSLLDTWHWNGTSWLHITTNANPGMRSGVAMACAPGGARALLFGGANNGGQDDTWEWDGMQWSMRSVTVKPPARLGCRAVFDIVSQRTYVFGGFFRGQPVKFFTDLWAWDGNAWSIAQGPTTPPGGFYCMAYDAMRSTSVMHDPSSKATWECGAQGWQRLPLSSAAPDAGDAMAYDDVRRRCILVGRTSSTGIYETWERRGTIWTKLTPKVSPFGLQTNAIAYDSARDRVVFLIDVSTALETWEFDGVTWARVATSRSPGRATAGLAYDRIRKQVVAIAGYVNLATNPGETWVYDGVDWIRKNTNDPVARAYYSLWYDPVRERVVLFGGGVFNSGTGPQILNDMYEWNGSSWAPASVPVGGPQRVAAHVAYDIARSRAVLFGGNGTGAGSDTYEYGPVTPGTGLAFGAGCPGSAGSPRLSPREGMVPWLGSPLVMDLTEIGSSTTANLPSLLLGDSRSQWGSIQLPFDLTPLGMPGCTLLAAPQVAVLLRNAGGIANYALQIPAAPSLLGATFYAQGVVTDASANPLGLTVSNAYQLAIGSK